MGQELEQWQCGHTGQEGEVFCLVSAVPVPLRAQPALITPFIQDSKQLVNFFIIPSQIAWSVL